MVAPIRPGLTPPPAGSTGGAARTAAQRAFFDQAMGRAAPTAAPAPAAPTQPTAPIAPVRPPVQAAANPLPSGDEPVRYRRPGSILDIKV